MKLLSNLTLVAIIFISSCQSLDKMLSLNLIQSPDSAISFRGVFAVDKNIAWVSGSSGAIFNTINGGQNWKKMEIAHTSDLDFRDIHVLSKKTVIVMSAGPGDQSRIYKSGDNGRTWALKFSNPYPDGFLNSIHFWDMNNGIAVGDPVNGYIFVLITRDGGENWEEIDNSRMPNALDGECGFAASGACVAVYEPGYAWIGTGGPKARVFLTKDMGHSWSVFESPIQSGKNSRGIFSIMFANENDGYISGGDYTNPDSLRNTFAYSKDGGQSWQLIENENLPFQSGFGIIDNKGTENFISTGPTGTYMSQNAYHWEQFSPLGFHCISVAKKDQTVWFAGSEGRVASIIVN